MSKNGIKIIRHVSIRDYCKVSGHKQRTITQMCQDGRVPGVIKIGRTWLIDLDKIGTIEVLKRGRPANKGAK
jgi:hypothetical protein